MPAGDLRDQRARSERQGHARRDTSPVPDVRRKDDPARRPVADAATGGPGLRALAVRAMPGPAPEP